jgi:hypothetical protein
MKSNLWESFSKEPDAAVKVIFDHVRNLGISAVTFGSGLWLFRLTTTDYRFVFMPLGVAAMVLGFVLMAINQLHGMLKLERSPLGRRSQIVIQIVYVAAVAALMTALIVRPR